MTTKQKPTMGSHDLRKARKEYSYGGCPLGHAVVYRFPQDKIAELKQAQKDWASTHDCTGRVVIPRPDDNE